MRTLVLAAPLLSPFLTASGQYVVTAQEGSWACENEGVMDSVKSRDQEAITGAAVLLSMLSDHGNFLEYSGGIDFNSSTRRS